MGGYDGYESSYARRSAYGGHDGSRRRSNRYDEEEERERDIETTRTKRVSKGYARYVPNYVEQCLPDMTADAETAKDISSSYLKADAAGGFMYGTAQHITSFLDNHFRYPKVPNRMGFFRSMFVLAGTLVTLAARIALRGVSLAGAGIAQAVRSPATMFKKLTEKEAKAVGAAAKMGAPLRELAAYKRLSRGDEEYFVAATKALGACLPVCANRRSRRECIKSLRKDMFPSRHELRQEKKKNGQSNAAGGISSDITAERKTRALIAAEGCDTLKGASLDYVRLNLLPGVAEYNLNLRNDAIREDAKKSDRSYIELSDRLADIKTNGLFIRDLSAPDKDGNYPVIRRPLSDSERTAIFEKNGYCEKAAMIKLCSGNDGCAGDAIHLNSGTYTELYNKLSAEVKGSAYRLEQAAAFVAASAGADGVVSEKMVDRAVGMANGGLFEGRTIEQVSTLGYNAANSEALSSNPQIAEQFGATVKTPNTLGNTARETYRAPGRNDHRGQAPNGRYVSPSYPQGSSGRGA